MIQYPTMKHLVSASDFTKDFMDHIFDLTKTIKKTPTLYASSLRGKIVATIFFEPSTRTRLSFESAIARLGGTCISTENAMETSSSVKGETTEDAIKVISHYADAIIIRHKDNETAHRATTVASVPVINAGSGTMHHPTQALLDLFTIKEYFGDIAGKKILIAGDLMRGRTCDSLAQALCQYGGMTIYFAAPEGCGIKDSLRSFLDQKKCKYFETGTLEHYIEEVDIVYMTRVQKERFEGNIELYEKVKNDFILTEDLVSKMHAKSIIMHPLPRIGEIPSSIDADPKAMYFTQAENGLWTRMAILYFILNEAKVLFGDQAKIVDTLSVSQ